MTAPVLAVPVAVPVTAVVAGAVVPYIAPAAVGGFISADAINEARVRAVISCAQVQANLVEAEW